MERIPRPGEIYRHFKGNLYRIVTLAQHTENGEQLVVYQGLYGDYPVYARPLSLFVGEVDHEKYPRVQERYRFTLIPEAGATVGAPCSPMREEGAAAERKPLATPVEEAGREPAETSDHAGTEAGAEGEFRLDPGLLAFLEADSYEKKL